MFLDAIYKTVSRRKFLELGGGAATALGAGSLAVGLNSTIMRSPVHASSHSDAKWKQYAGSKLVFMSENTPPSFAIRDTISNFYDLTGIEVEVITDGLPAVQQKVGIDLQSGNADFPVSYVQDKPIGSPFADYYADLTPMLSDDTLPQDPEGYGDGVWFDNFLDACGRFYDRERLIAFLMIVPWRTPSIAKMFRSQLQGLRGRVWLPDGIYGGHHLEAGHEFTAFLKKLRESGKDVPYGYAQHHGTFAWTTQLDIQRMMFAHGRWLDWEIDDKLGSKTPPPSNWGDEQSVLLMQKFKDHADVCHLTTSPTAHLVNTVYRLVTSRCRFSITSLQHPSKMKKLRSSWWPHWLAPSERRAELDR